MGDRQGESEERVGKTGKRGHGRDVQRHHSHKRV
jgi:hypothetical protein